MRNDLKGQYVKVHMHTIQLPPDAGMLHHYRDRWWAVTEDNCVLMYEGKYPQCNVNREIVKHVISPQNGPKVVGEVFINSAFWPLDLKDYA